MLPIRRTRLVIFAYLCVIFTNDQLESSFPFPDDDELASECTRVVCPVGRIHRCAYYLRPRAWRIVPPGVYIDKARDVCRLQRTFYDAYALRVSNRVVAYLGRPDAKGLYCPTRDRLSSTLRHSDVFFY